MARVELREAARPDGRTSFIGVCPGSTCDYQTLPIFTRKGAEATVEGHLRRVRHGKAGAKKGKD